MRLAEATQLGLETKYTYRVTQVADLGQGQQLVRVKNCSGPNFVKWIGAWNPNDSRWTNVSEEAKKELDAETYHDGGFWMAYGDFLKYFKVVFHAFFTRYCNAYYTISFFFRRLIFAI